jgi:hypothetical protein
MRTLDSNITKKGVETLFLVDSQASLTGLEVELEKSYDDNFRCRGLRRVSSRIDAC